jgi:hypothetical protein
VQALRNTRSNESSATVEGSGDCTSSFGAPTSEYVLHAMLDSSQQAQFIDMVRTALIVHYSATEKGGPNALQRSIWSVQRMSEAYKLAQNVPPDVTSEEAAEAFVTWVIDPHKLTADEQTIVAILLNSHSGE